MPQLPLARRIGGMRGPALDSIASRMTEDQMIRQVLQGGGNMPAYGNALSPAETRALVAFLMTLRGKGNLAPAVDASRKLAQARRPVKYRHCTFIRNALNPCPRHSNPCSPTGRSRSVSRLPSLSRQQSTSAAGSACAARVERNSLAGASSRFSPAWPLSGSPSAHPSTPLPTCSSVLT